MDVSLSGRRVSGLLLRRSIRATLLALPCVALISCGNRYDLSTAAGQQSRIDDANSFLSHGDCSSADAAITPLYDSQYVTDQVRIIKASAQACFARFNLLTFASNLVGSQNYFVSLAKSLDNSAGDAARFWLYNAVDVLTQNGAAMSGGVRSTAVNSYMVFVQLGVVSAILRNYGNPDANGNQQTDLTYPHGNMNDADACALAAAFSFITDSFANADLSDSDSKNLTASLNNVCVTAGLSSCSAINRDRSKCDGANGASVTAGAVATGVNNGW